MTSVTRMGAFGLALLIACVMYGCKGQSSGGTEEEASRDSASSLEELHLTSYLASQDETNADDEPEHPFRRRIDFPFDFPESADWLNTSGKIRMEDLKGKFVLMDFWTYCCINCMHVLPELKKLEQKYPDQLVVIGVHSAKFDTEKDTENIKDAILRHEIEHPVVNDPEMEIWRKIGISAWPTLLLIDPNGQAVWIKSGETKFEVVDKVLSDALPYYRAKGLLDETPVHFHLHSVAAPETPLKYPGKLLADADSNRLFIADSNHNRIVIADLAGKLIDTIGTGVVGSTDGDYASAQFNHPQGMALLGDWLYVADTENHLLRKINLAEKTVETIAGTGEQAASAFPGLDRLNGLGQLPERWVGEPKTTAISSPWAVFIKDNELFIAMAGPHQIWKMPLDESEIYPYAGNGREDIVDGPLMPVQPYRLGFASFAQPSGLASDGEWLYVADSEGSSIRAVPFDPEGEVRTVVGTAGLPGARLFTFGDKDGDRDDVLLQHCIGIAYHDGQIFVADTYNNKIKVVDAATGATRTLAGDGEPGLTDDPVRFDEPAGLSYSGGKLYVADTNNHLVRVVDPATGATSTLEIEGLQPPPKPERPERPDFESAEKITLDVQAVKVVDGKVRFDVAFGMPLGWKINPIAPMVYYVDGAPQAGVVSVDQLPGDAVSLDPPRDSFEITVPISEAGQGIIKVSTTYFYCQDGGEGLCKVGSVVWTVPFVAAEDAESDKGKISLDVQPSF